MKKRAVSIFLNILSAALLIAGIYLIVKPYWQNYLQDGLISDVLAQMGEANSEMADNGQNNYDFVPVKEIDVSFRPDEYIVSGEAWEDFSNPEFGREENSGHANKQDFDDIADYVKVHTYARMDIPSIGFSMPVANEATLYSLRLGVGHHKTSARFGKSGNAVIFGHRGYRRGRYLNNVHNMKRGDEIRIVTSSHAYIYKMTKSLEINPLELMERLNEQTDKARIILVSCTPLKKTGNVKRGDHRILIYGELWKTIPLD